MTSHQVVFHIGTGRVVCACGADFRSEPSGFGIGLDAVYFWAQHLKQETGGATRADIWDEGFTACAHEHMHQRDDPTYALTRSNPYGKGGVEQ